MSDDFVYEDRRKRDLLTGGVDLWINSLEFAGSVGLQLTGEPLATVGDRIALERYLWTGEPDGVAIEGEMLVLTEVDANGRLRAAISFDLDDRRAAFAEAQARFVTGEAGVVGGQAPFVAFWRAFAQRDWKTFRSCLADDAVVHDHRTLSVIGALSRDEWIESRRVLADLAPDVDEEPLHILDWNRHGRVSVGRLFGTMRDGGPFEILFVGVYLTRGDRIQRYEFFDVGDTDRARARFEELTSHGGSGG